MLGSTMPNTSSTSKLSVETSAAHPSENGVPYIPALKDFDIHPIHGFLPADPPPLRRLPAYYEPWEVILDDLQAYLVASAIRKAVNKLPLLSTDNLTTLREWQRAYLVLSFVGQAYVWGKNEEISSFLPVVIARPWYTTAQHLGIKPVITYAAVELYNYRLLDPQGPWDLSNFSVMHTFTGPDEAWFYLISIATESVGAKALPAIVDSLQAVVKKDLPALTQNLSIISDAIEDITKVLVRMYEKNDPHIFYHRVRTYVAGWENNSELPDGLFYEGVLATDCKSPTAPQPSNNILKGEVTINGEDKPYPVQKSVQNLSESFSNQNAAGTYRKYAGASAGQSSLIHCLDVALGVEHHPTRTPKSTPVSSAQCSATNLTSESPSHPPLPANAGPPRRPINHIHEMRKYMPGPHREFIYALERAPSIRKFVDHVVNSLEYDPLQTEEVSRMYNRCVEGMRAFRDRHLQVVATYIVIQARKKKEVGHLDVPQEAQSRRVAQSLQARGTGGTDLIPFLKQSRDETTEAVVQLDV
ncbi:Indoleamine 2,3-dioxygenase [Phlyctochytrium arcticum]|nr:Indoleamine 2,3-dioxygenase [Phlyctochytrium arcticum]